MKIVLKTKQGLINTYWVTFKEKEGMILGWFGGTWMKQTLNFDEIHFYFPIQTGEYHFSYKKFDTDTYITVYSDLVTIKSRPDNKHPPIITTQSREEFDKINSGLSILLPINSSPTPINKLDFFSFPSSGFNILNGTFGHGKTKISKINIKPDDILIDVSEMQNISISINALIRRKGLNHAVPSIENTLKCYSKSISILETHVLEVRCLLRKN